MSVRRWSGVGAVVLGAVLLAASAAPGQLSLDRVQRASSDQGELAFNSWESGRAAGAAREVIQNLPASYLRSETSSEENDAENVRRREAARRDRQVVNLIVFGGLASSFGLGLAITLVTLRKRKSLALPQRLF